MSRAAILPYPGDPFLINYWLDIYDKYWHSEIDNLYIVLNSTIERPVVDYIHERVKRSPNTNWTYINRQIEHGDAINRALDIVQEDYVMLIEDDAFIFKPGAVEECFRILEVGAADIVGSKRGSCSMEILKAAKDKWGIDYGGYGDQGCNFWPCYFFTKTSILKATSRHFGARAWTTGERIEPLEYDVAVPVVNGDTFVNTSLELRAMIPEERIAYVPQYHAHPSDLDHYRAGQFLFDGKAPWTHIGSLSSGVGGILQDNYSRPLTRRLIDPEGPETELPKWVNTEQEKQEFERRVTWWLTFWENVAPTPINPIYEFHEAYGLAVQRVIDQYKLRRKNIMLLQKAYKTLGL